MKAPERPKGTSGARPDLAKCLSAEFIGTFALTLVSAGAIVVDDLSHGEIGHVGKTVAPGLVVMAMIYSLGHASGAHINPAVTLSFVLRRSFPWLKAPAYWAAQFLGAIAAALALKLAFGSVADLGATIPHVTIGVAFWTEVVLSAILILVVLGTASNYSLVGPDAAIAVGATVALLGLFSSPLTGASMNPARSIGPALVAAQWRDQWIYLVAPIVGGLLATAISLALYDKDPKEDEAAQGSA